MGRDTTDAKEDHRCTDPMVCVVGPLLSHEEGHPEIIFVSSNKGSLELVRKGVY